MVGIEFHGFHNWDRIAQDERLGLTTKLAFVQQALANPGPGRGRRAAPAAGPGVAAADGEGGPGDAMDVDGEGEGPGGGGPGPNAPASGPGKGAKDDVPTVAKLENRASTLLKRLLAVRPEGAGLAHIKGGPEGAKGKGAAGAARRPTTTPKPRGAGAGGLRRAGSPGAEGATPATGGVVVVKAAGAAAPGASPVNGAPQPMAPEAAEALIRERKEGNQELIALMEPVKPILSKLKMLLTMDDEDIKIKKARKYIVEIGDHIDGVGAGPGAASLGGDLEDARLRMWKYVRYFTKHEMTAEQLSESYRNRKQKLSQKAVGGGAVGPAAAGTVKAEAVGQLQAQEGGPQAQAQPAAATAAAAVVQPPPAAAAHAEELKPQLEDASAKPPVAAMVGAQTAAAAPAAGAVPAASAPQVKSAPEADQ